MATRGSVQFDSQANKLILKYSNIYTKTSSSHSSHLPLQHSCCVKHVKEQHPHFCWIAQFNINSKLVGLKGYNSSCKLGLI